MSLPPSCAGAMYEGTVQCVEERLRGDRRVKKAGRSRRVGAVGARFPVLREECTGQAACLTCAEEKGKKLFLGTLEHQAERLVRCS